MANTIEISNSYIINSFSSSLNRGERSTAKQVTSENGEKTITFTNHFGEANISVGDVLRISDGGTTIDYTISHPGGEYQVSSSVESGTNLFQTIVGGIGSSGGGFSPDGTKLAVKTMRHGGAGSTDTGVDVYTSSSVGGWARTDSIDVDPAVNVQLTKWFSNSELWTHNTSNQIIAYNSGSGGFGSPVTRVAGNGGYDAFEWNPAKTLLAAWDHRQTSLKIWSSASGNWSSDSSRTISNPGGSGVEIEGFSWVNDDTFIIGMPTYSTTGRLEVWSTGDSGATWNEVESLDGGSGDAIGSSIYYQTSSGNILVGDGRSTSEANSIYLIMSSSADGILPSDWASSKTFITGNLRRIIDVSTVAAPDTDSIVYMVSSHESSPYNQGKLFSIESGSAGWKATTIDGAVAVIPDPGVWGTQIGVSSTSVVFNDGSRPVDESVSTADFKVHYSLGLGLGASGGDASSPTEIGGGSDRSALLVVDEIITKVLASALDVTAVDNGGTSTNASFKLSPGAGKTLTITEDPSGDGNFGSTSGFTTIANVTTTTSTNLAMAPFRFMTPGIMNVRGQTTGKGTQTFLGEQKS